MSQSESKPKSGLNQLSQQRLLDGGFPPSLIRDLGKSAIASTKINDYFKNPSNYATYDSKNNGLYSKGFQIHAGVKDFFIEKKPGTVGLIS